MKPITLTALVAAVLALVLAGGERDAAAYPQFQLARDQTCTNCHLSPSGGGLLNENGLNVAEGISQFGTKPEFFYGKVDPPSWLALGGDLRGLAGYFQTPFKTFGAFPMQGEVYATAMPGAGISIHITAGIRPPESGNKVATSVWAREHYVMWQQHEGEPSGLFVRVGHFMPVFGLRLPEHDDYTRRFGGVSLDYDTYAAAAEYIDQTWEAHVTGFVRDRLIDAASQDSGVAVYAEMRQSTSLSFGVEGMVTASKDDYKQRVGVTNKVLLPGDVLLQTELILTRQDIRFPVTDDSPAGYRIQSELVHQLAGYLLASKFLKDFLLLDVGFGHYDENIRYAGLDRDCLDANLHWFSTSHLELVLNTRLEAFDHKLNSNTGAYAALQLHYRL